MMLRASRLHSARSVRVVWAAVAIVLGPAALAAGGADGAPWRLSQDGSARSCPVTLRFDPAGAAGALAMPAGCRRAFPSLISARAWSIGDDGAIQFRDATGQSLLTLGRHAGIWQGDDESGRGYTLSPPGGASAASQQPDPSDAEDQGAVALASPQIMTTDPRVPLDRGVVRLAAAASKPVAGPSSEAAATGRYAVMRGDRDTGCMVTLEGSGKGASRARLAPACRDQGITIFDPVGWQMKGSQLVLTARKGHSISLAKDDGGLWIKMPKDAKALGLKPL